MYLQGYRGFESLSLRIVRRDCLSFYFARVGNPWGNRTSAMASSRDCSGPSASSVHVRAARRYRLIMTLDRWPVRSATHVRTARDASPPRREGRVGARRPSKTYRARRSCPARRRRSRPESRSGGAPPSTSARRARRPNQRPTARIVGLVFIEHDVPAAEIEVLPAQPAELVAT